MEICKSFFSVVLNMSLTGGIVIVAVLLVRLLLRRVPKIFSYLLWGVVLLRLLCPVSFSSVLSVFQVVDISVTEQGMMQYMPQQNVQSGRQEGILPVQTSKNTSVGTNQYTASYSGFMDKIEGSAQSSWDFEMVCSVVWIMGVTVLWVYSAVSIIFLKRKLIGAVSDEKNADKNIYLCDYIGTAFVMGVLRPRIYLPTTLTENERRYILLHEETHIRRFDHIFRLMAFFALSIHWFNPLVWCAFSLSERDMEMSCDEAVMRKMGTDLRAAYSASLLNLASGKKVFAGAPLGFGEGNVKCRIQNIMRYKKTAALIAVPVLALVIVVSVALGSNPAEKSISEDDPKENSIEGNHSAVNDANIQQTDQNGESAAADASIAVKPAVITDQMVCDIDGPILDYADENILIFHHYFGLFVYDITQSRLDSSVNLRELGCLNAQDELDCEVFVSKAGQEVYLCPEDAVNMYVYDVPSKKLVQQYYDRESFANNTDLFGHLKLTTDCIDPDYTVWRSADCVTLADYRYLYLECGSGMVEDLYFIVEQDRERVQFAKIFEDDTKVGGLFDYGDYTGYLDECTDWDGYEQFVHQDYDGDGKVDRVYRENIADYEMCTYSIEFGNGDLIQTKEIGMGMPTVRTCDLNGDGVREILVQVYYGFGTDPNAYGETALFEKKNGSYEPLMPPEELCTYMEGKVPGLQGGNDLYNPSITVVYRNSENEFPEWASMPPEVYQEVSTPHIHLTVKELTGEAAVDTAVFLDSNLMFYYGDIGTEEEHQSVSYDVVIVNDGKKDLIEFHFEAFNKWSLDEIVVTAAYENGELHVVGSRYVRESDIIGLTTVGKENDITPVVE
ncbi:MAG: M56 family metallopeptidase [Lachnospiraceae bacterium]|nr:M56 family metallopeptidase [Lachnospiraceae bacterium]